jgi:linoleoyl-CoA desaturase
VFFAEEWWQAVPLAISLAFSLAAIAFNIQHDGGHSAYSDRTWVNRLAALTMDLVGASSYLWRWKHGILHHTYPNVKEMDTDIEAGPIARLTPAEPHRWFHRWQHLYLWPLYGITAARWHLMTDFQEVAKGSIGPHRVPRPRSWDLLCFLLGKVVSIGLLLGIPMIFHPWWIVVPMYFLVAGTVGVTLTIVFQLAHCVGEADFPGPSEDNRMPDAWAVHQINTTVDFARESKLAFWFLGGLNFQVVHHLFPRICHVHYPAISKIVEATCRDHGIVYRTHGSFASGLLSHYRWLRRLGRGEENPLASAR